MLRKVCRNSRLNTIGGGVRQSGRRCHHRHHHLVAVSSSSSSFGAVGFPSTTDSSHLDAAASITRRHFADNLMGYSPMSPSLPKQTASSKNNNIPSAQEVSTSGGVWAPTSAKRDKLSELNLELTETQTTLDDAATPDELLDLYLTDGLKLIAKTVDHLPDNTSPPLVEFAQWLQDQATTILPQQNDDSIDEVQLEAHLAAASEKLLTLQMTIPSDKCLRDVRDFFDASEVPDDELPKLEKLSDIGLQDTSFQDAVTRFRLQLTRAAAEHLRVSWKTLTTVSDADVDRAATQGEQLERQAKTVSLSKIHAVLRSHVGGTCADRLDAMWELLDRDGDGLLDEQEMNDVAFLCLTPYQQALPQLFDDAIEAYPIRAPLPEIGSTTTEVPQPKGFRQRRRETKLKKRLTKAFQKSCQNHFQDEVEINHRLRCIYAWAEKAHQDNKLDSVMVDEGWSGRKRYVELSPKISLVEFREVQSIHFTHFGRIGAEILKSYREDLWVMQGKGRQNKELFRDSLLFLAGVSAIDYIILSL